MNTPPGIIRLPPPPVNPRHAREGARYCVCGSALWRRLVNRTGRYRTPVSADGRMNGENGSDCRVCFLARRPARRSEFIAGDDGVSDDGVETRAEGNAYVDEDRDDMNAPVTWCAATLEYRALVEKRERREARARLRPYTENALTQVRIHLGDAWRNANPDGPSCEYGFAADLHIGHTSRDVPCFNERRHHSVNVSVEEKTQVAA